MALKAFFYSIAVLIILTPLIALVVFYSINSSQSYSAGVSKVVSREAVNFINSIDSDFSRALGASGKSAVLSAISTVVSEGAPLADSRASLKNLVVNGSADGSAPSYPAMGFNYLSHWTSSMQNLSLYYGLNSTISITPNDVSVSNYGPYAVLFSANVSVFVKPLANPDSFNFTRVYSAVAVVSIESFEDPLYALNSQGIVSRLFYANSSDVFGIAALDNAITSEAYVPNPDSPDFFNRLEGNLSASQFGIETIVNLNEFIAQDLPIRNQSHADHLYFNTTLSDQGNRVTGSSHAWLKLDCAHAAFYGVTAQTPGC
ncbi:MAG: hypothetical protein QXR53_03505 [Candidatus Norongarragalinales archaeon]